MTDETTVLEKFVCPECGKEFANAAGLGGHARTHISHSAAPAPDEVNRSPRVKGAVRQYGQRRMGMRALKMIRPICQECQSQDDAPGWWYRCIDKGHQPYFSADREDFKTKRKTERDEDGDLVITGEVKVPIIIQGGPNLAQVLLTGRHNADQHTAMRKARGKGFREPQELGLDPFCDAFNCWSQDDLQDYEGLGRYCSKDQAKAVAADQRHIKLEVLNDEQKVNQWAEISV
jgi:hypothetical protein